jgi:predicted Zn-dependent protease
VPEWLSTHPDPGNRVAATQARLDTLSRSLDNTITNRDGFLQHINGLVYGADPRQGFFEGTTFYHPGMRFQMTFPEGWQTQNTPAAVVAASPNQDAIIQLGLAGKSTPREAASQFLSQQGIQAGDGSTQSINGNEAATSYFQAQTEQGAIEGIVSFIAYGGQTYGILGYAGTQQFGSHENAIKEAIRSFGQLRNQDAMNVKPNKVELVRLSRAMTLNEFNQQYPSTIPITELAIINEMANATDQIPQGRVVKRVTGGQVVKKQASPASGQ